MTLDQICDGGLYPGAVDVRAGVATGSPGIFGTLRVSGLGLRASDLRSGVTVDDITGTLLTPGPSSQILTLSQQGA
jgi:hypothetical protein